MPEYPTLINVRFQKCCIEEFQHIIAINRGYDAVFRILTLAIPLSFLTPNTTNFGTLLSAYVSIIPTDWNTLAKELVSIREIKKNEILSTIKMEIINHQVYSYDMKLVKFWACFYDIILGYPSYTRFY